MPRRVYKLTDSEKEIMRLSVQDGSVFTRYWFGGWDFDYKIDPAWQKQVHHASQSQIVIIAGAGAGKTGSTGISAATWAATTFGFKFMNLAPTLNQARLMMDYILEKARGNPFEKLIYNTSSKQDDLKIVLRHDLIGESTLLFKSAADLSDRVLGFEMDWIHIDEFGLLKDIAETMPRLVTRMRGSVTVGEQTRERVGRISMTSNPHINPEMYYLYDMAKEDPECLSLTISARTNGNVTNRQIKNMLRNIPKEDHERWIDGERPEGESEHFPPKLVSRCEDLGLDEIMDAGIARDEETFIRAITPRADVTTWQLPADERRSYLVVMDAGQGAPPWRNAPVITAWDITDFPKKPAEMRLFWWGDGRGSYQPCITQFKFYRAYYKADWAVFDSTGTQSGFEDMFALQEDDLGCYGWNLAGNVKMQSILALKLLMTKGLMRWPSKIKGIRNQHVTYTLPDAKLAQDIVSNFCITAGFLRRFYWIDVNPEEEVEEPSSPVDRFGRVGVDRFSREVVGV